jgi:hypothetical protein
VITKHAQLRAQQRAGQAQSGCPSFFQALWALGRPASAADFERWLICPLPDREYRVAIRGGCVYVVVRGHNGDFITVIKRADRAFFRLSKRE